MILIVGMLLVFNPREQLSVRTERDIRFADPHRKTPRRQEQRRDVILTDELQETFQDLYHPLRHFVIVRNVGGGLDRRRHHLQLGETGHHDRLQRVVAEQPCVVRYVNIGDVVNDQPLADHERGFDNRRTVLD